MKTIIGDRGKERKDMIDSVFIVPIYQIDIKPVEQINIKPVYSCDFSILRRMYLGKV